MQVTQTLNLFSPEECLDIIKMGDALPQVDWEYEAGAHRGTVNLKKTGAALLVDQKTQWIVDKIWPFITGIGRHTINRLEQLQYGVYEKGGFMDWHLDRGTEEGEYPEGVENNYMAARVIGGILQLSHPDDYVGGAIEIMNQDGSIAPCRKARGSLVVLGSDALHRVTEVTQGVRRTLVIWGLK